MAPGGDLPPPGVVGGGQERQQAEGLGCRPPAQHSRRNVNCPRPRAPGEARRARACPRSHSSTQIAALGGTLTSRSGSSCLPLQSPRYNRQRLLSSALLAQPCPGSERKRPRCPAAPLSQRLPGAGAFPFAPPAGPGPMLSSGNRPASAPRYPSCAPAEAWPRSA